MPAGAINEQITGDKFSLQEGTNTWQLKTLVSLKLSRQLFRNATPAGPALSYGTGNHSLDATIVASSPDIATMVAYSTRNTTSGNVPEKNWKLVAKPINNGAAINLSFKAILSDLEISHEENGKVMFTIHLDISSDTITVS